MKSKYWPLLMMGMPGSPFKSSAMPAVAMSLNKGKNLPSKQQNRNTFKALLASSQPELGGIFTAESTNEEDKAKQELDESNEKFALLENGINETLNAFIPGSGKPLEAVWKRAVPAQKAELILPFIKAFGLNKEMLPNSDFYRKYKQLLSDDVISELPGKTK